MRWNNMDKLKAITIADNESFLRQISGLVDLSDNELIQNISTLEQFCKENEVMAMAAIQLGIPKRLVYLKNNKIHNFVRFFFNVLFFFVILQKYFNQVY